MERREGAVLENKEGRVWESEKEGLLSSSTHPQSPTS